MRLVPAINEGAKSTAELAIAESVRTLLLKRNVLAGGGRLAQRRFIVESGEDAGHIHLHSPENGG